MSKKQHEQTSTDTSLGCEGKKGEGKEKKRAEEKGDIPDPRRLARSAGQHGDVRRGRQQMKGRGINGMVE